MNTIKITFGALIRLLLELKLGKDIVIFQCEGNTHRVWLAFEDTPVGFINYDFNDQYAFGISESVRPLLEMKLLKQESDNPFRD